MQVQPSLSGRSLFALFVAFAVVWMGSLGYRKLVGPDEGRYAEIAREMVVSGNWVTPRLDGIKYFEKPPLQYWATAVAFATLGESDFAARLWPGATGLLCVLATFFAGRRLFGAEAGLLAAAVAAGSLLFVLIGHFGALDMGLTCCLQLTLCGFLLAQQGTAPAARRWMLFAWAMLALAVLAKGLVALVLTGATLVLYSLVTRDLSPWRRLAPLPGVVLFLAIAAPWFVAVSLANPEFAHFFFIHEHFERFLTKTHGRYQPPWYFVPILLAGLLPWTGLALQTLPAAWRKSGAGDFQPRRFLLLWCVVVFGFFSASGSKLPSYILPLFPALALLLGEALPRIGRRALITHVGLIGVLAAVALLLAPRVAGLGDEGSPPAMMAAYSRWLMAAAAIWLAAALAALWLAVRARRVAALLVLTGGSLIAGLGVLLGHDSLAPANSAYQIARSVRPLLRADTPFYSLEMYDQTLPFYLGRTVTPVDYRDELDFGLQQEPGKWVPTLDEFARRWSAPGAAYAIMRPSVYERLAARHELPLVVVARDPRRVIVRNRREP